MRFGTDTYDVFDTIDKIKDREKRARIILACLAPLRIEKPLYDKITTGDKYKSKKEPRYKFSNEDKILIINGLMHHLNNDDLKRITLPDLKNSKTCEFIAQFQDLPTQSEIDAAPIFRRADLINPDLSPVENLAVSHQLQAWIAELTGKHDGTRDIGPALLFRPTFDARFRGILQQADDIARDEIKEAQDLKNGSFLLKFWDSVSEYRHRICVVGQINAQRINQLLTSYKETEIPAFNAHDGVDFNENGALRGWEILPEQQADDRPARDMLKRLAKTCQVTDKIKEIAQALEGAEIALANIIEPILLRYGPNSILLSNGKEDIIETLANNTASDVRLSIRQMILLPGSNAHIICPITGKKLDLLPLTAQERLSLADPATWRRKLRKTGLSAQGLMTSSLAMANENKHYCSDHSVMHYVERKAKERAYLAKKAVRFEKADGSTDTISLLDVADDKTSADIAEVYAINKAYEHEAKTLGLDAYFLTLTLPGEFHPSPRRCHGQLNADWNTGYGLEEAGAEIQKMWRSIMREIKKTPEFLGAFGMKVLEPHKDGCPHLHAMLYLPPTYQINENGIFSEGHTQQKLNEIVAQFVPGEHQREIRLIRKDTTGGEASMSPASYVMKYILKSMKDAGDRPDLLTGNIKSKDPETRARAKAEMARFRHKAWLGTLGRRGFSFVGMRGIRGIWRKLWNATPESLAGAGPALLGVKNHIDNAQRALEDGDNEEATKSCTKALRELGAFPHFQTNYTIKLLYNEHLTRHGNINQKAEQVAEIDNETGEVFLVDLKDKPTKIVPYLKELDKTKPDDRREIHLRECMVAREERRAEITQCAIPWLYEDISARARDALVYHIAMTFSDDLKEARKAETKLTTLLNYLSNGLGDQEDFHREYNDFKRWGTNSYLSKRSKQPHPPPDYLADEIPF